MNESRNAGKPLNGKRILVCGKGGSGKSTVVALMATTLDRMNYETLILDGDASNPEGLVPLVFGVSGDQRPKPLIEFFGGVDAVECPVDDPAPLQRIDKDKSAPEAPIDVFEEIPGEYYLRAGNTTLLQAGKINTYGQGCDGPVEKVVRDFMVKGDSVNIIDMKAGIEHFGRRVPDRMNAVLGVLDCSLESVSIAKRMDQFRRDAGINNYWLILNKVESRETESLMTDQLGDLRDKVIGSIGYDQKVIQWGLSGTALGDCPALDGAASIVERLEQKVSTE